MDQSRHKKILLVLLLGISMGAMLLLASGLPNLRFQPGKSLNLLDWLLARLTSVETIDQIELGTDTRGENSSDVLTQLGEGILRSVIVVFWLMLIFSIVYAIVSPKFRKELVRMFAMIFPLMILLPYIAKRLAMQQRLSGEEAPGELMLGDATLIETPSFIQQPPEWLFILVNFLLLGLLFVGIYLVWWRFRPKSDAHAVVVRQVRRALLDLDAGLGLKDVVIACYSRMCQGLQQSQRIHRKQDMTPREFEDHLASAGIASAHIQQLTRLFEGVRYGAKASDATAELEAKECLQAILQAYGD
jgi:hypothetical protein